MKFEVINDKGVTIMNTEYLSCIPNKHIVNCMSEAGYKFKLNGKVTSKKMLQEFISKNTQSKIWEESCD